MKPKKTHEMNAPKKNYYFLGVTTVSFKREADGPEESVTINTLMECATPAIRSQELDSLNRGALSQAAQMYELTQDQITRLTVNNIIMLAHCTAEQFNDMPKGKAA